MSTAAIARHRHGTASPVRAAIEILPRVFNPTRVAADQARDHVILQIRDDRELATVQGRIADPVHTWSVTILSVTKLRPGQVTMTWAEVIFIADV